MPSMNELSDIYGAWNPQAYMRGADQADLSMQMSQQELQQKQLEAQAKSLSNMYDQNTLGERSRRPGLENQGIDLTNQGRSLDLQSKRRVDQREAAMQQYNLDADQRKALMGITEDDLKQGDLHAEQLIRSLDPKEQEKGQQLYNMTKAVREARQKTADAMDLERYKQQQETGRGVERNQSAERIAEMNVAGRQAVADSKAKAKGGISSVYDAVKSGKVAPDKAAAAFGAAALQARTQGDMETAQEYENAAGTMEALSKSTRPDTMVGKPDLAPLGITPIAPTAPTFDRNPGRSVSGPVAPPVGTVQKGHIFMGGDPSKPSSWKKQ